MAISSINNSSTDEKRIEQQRPSPPQISEQEKAEFDSFREKILEAASSGTLDAASLAESAPESFKKAVESRGDSLESVIEQIASGKDPEKGMRGPGGPKPSPESSTSGTGNAADSTKEVDGISTYATASVDNQSDLNKWRSFESNTAKTSSSCDVPAPNLSCIDSEDSEKVAAFIKPKKDKSTDEIS